MGTTFPAPAPPLSGAAVPVRQVTTPQLYECPGCGQMQILPALPAGARAVCVRCDAVLRHTRRDPLLLPLALNISALILFGLGATLTLMSVSTAGQRRVADLITGPAEMEHYGLWEISLVVLITTVAAPLARVLCMLTVLIGLRLKHPPAGLRLIYAWVQHLRPWSMIEIYLLGLFVAYVRLSGMATVNIGPAIYALGGLMLVMVLADCMLDNQAVWEAMEPRNRRRRRTLDENPAIADRATPNAHRWRIGCDTCGLVSRAAPGMRCTRCGFRLHVRKPGSIERTWAFAIAAVVLYIPANIYPVLTVVRLGTGDPSTILGGVGELLDLGMWPLAALVFFASVAVPVLKLIGLGILLISTHTGSGKALRDRTILYRIVDAIGRWSMIDIFMESILVALVQFGQLASVYPGPGAIAFAAVVILTMLAAHSFDPRLMWDSARDRAEKTPPETDRPVTGRPETGRLGSMGAETA
ncbi:MAG: paraquat-inducible protein [Acetobacteraceae bacterium]|jgi:paraquat-inducible protein A|nr:paraquat-inducible protein [Rhodopila sp.]MEA2727262.1 paraquat-inducible protein [Acetobacteraceae bacterium]MEA2771913.1 paraquat-inducible protein [Acetobacteraceae bacterium]